VVSVQPNGQLGIQLQQLEDDNFQYILRNLESEEIIAQLGVDTPYLNAFSWSSNGENIAFVQPRVNPATNLLGGEIFLISSTDYRIRQMTNFTQQYGQVRINGHAMNTLSWSPDGNKLAFWVVPILGTNIEQNLGDAIIHILDVPTGVIQSYCHFSTIEHTPNPPRLVWSPDSTHLMFGGNVPADDKGYLLLALDIATGQFTELSDGIYPALGTADVLTWGIPLN
jgi:Tol biopolymer transport system component